MLTRQRSLGRRLACPTLPGYPTDVGIAPSLQRNTDTEKGRAGVGCRIPRWEFVQMVLPAV